MKSKISQAQAKGFMQGYACAVYMADSLDGEQSAKRIVEGGNFTYEDFKNEDIDPVDLKVICRAMRKKYYLEER